MDLYFYTGYFAKHGKLPNAISIAQGTPQWFKGFKAIELCPSWEMVKNKPYPYEEYVEKVLNFVSPLIILEKYNGMILCCYEKDRSQCHRGYLARWIKEKVNIEIREHPGPAVLKPISQISLF